MKSFVYFVQAASGAIKIGVTRHVQARLAAMRTTSPEPLSLLGAVPGDAAFERALHQQFADVRIRNEWFLPAPHLMQEIETLLTDSSAEDLSPDAPPIDDEYTKAAMKWLSSIEDREAKLRCQPVLAVRPKIAARMGFTPGFMENLRRSRIREVSARAHDILRRARIADILAELREIEAVFVQIITEEAEGAPSLSKEDAASVEAGLAALRRIMSDGMKGN